MAEKGVLYLAATPIGNLGDMSDRLKQTLAEVDFIAAEDTRVSVKLLNHLDVKKPLVSYFEHNKTVSGPKIVERLLSGESCAMVTDAGMPAVSDPGEDLVRLCAEANVPVICVPGPSAVVTALAVSALPTGRFCFEGFLSTAKKSRFEHLESLKNESRTMIFYEAPHKLLRTLNDMAQYFGNGRRVSVCRELTKLHEQVLRTTLGEAAAYYGDNTPKGEFVLVVEGAAEPAEQPGMSMEEALREVDRLRQEGESLRDAAAQAAETSGISRNELYRAAIKENK